MNWTGGRLQRASGPADLGITQQKQHFAKVKASILKENIHREKANTHKANLLNGRTPIKAQFSNGRQEDIHKSPRWSARRLSEIDIFQNRDIRPSRDPKRRGNEQQDRASIGGERQTVTSNDEHDGRQRNDYALRSDENGKMNARQEVNGVRYRHQSPRLSSTSGRHGPGRTSRLPSNLDDPSHRVLSVQIKGEPALDEDLYEATPPPHRKKREREDWEPASNSGNEILSDTEESMLSKRRRLILKGDWVGVGFQRPPQLTFVATRQQDKVAKRRRITDGHQARYSTRQAIITSPFAKRNRAPLIEPPSAQQSLRVNPGRSDVRISIGGKVVPPGISSSSVHSKSNGHQHTVLSDRPATRSSDVMLLDNEQRVFCGIESHRGLVTGEVKCYDAESRQYYSLYQHPGLPVHHHPMNEPLFRTSSKSSASHGGHRGQDSKERHNAGRVQNTNERQSSHSQDRLHRERDLTSDMVDSPRHLKRIKSRDIESKRPGSTRLSTPIYSSSVSLQHPKPQSSRVSSILQSASTEIDESTVAQVGREKPVVPSSQVLDNEVWESWLAPLQAEGGEVDQGQPGMNQRISISPGISAAPTYRHANEDTSSDVDLDIQDLESPQSYEEDSDAHFSPAIMSQKLLREPNSELGADLQEDLESTNAVVLDQAPPEPLSALALTKATPKATEAPSISKHAGAEDNDDIWKQFVFSGGSDEPDLEPPKSASPAPAGRSKYASLMQAHLKEVNSTKPSAFGTPYQSRGVATPARQSSSSLLNSRMANSSPSHSGFKGENSHSAVGPVDSSSRSEVADSVRASGGSLHSWGSNSGLATVVATVLPRSSPRTGSAGDNVGFKMQKRVRFTKPKPS
jgi:hypothetical protein